MSKKEILEMQRRIDEGIRLAQKRLWERARNTQHVPNLHIRRGT